MTRIIKSISIAAGLSLTLFTMNAQATVNKMHHGSQCQPLYGFDHAKMYHTPYGGIYNASTTDYIILTCPLNRDYASNSQSFRSFPYVYHVNFAVTYCALTKVENYGLGYQESFGFYNGQFGNQMPIPDITSDAMNKSSVTLYCFLAPGGFLNSIRYWDNGAS